MAEKPEIGKKEKLKKEAAVSSVEIKLKDKLGDRVAFTPDHGCGNEPPKNKLPPRVDEPPKCGNEPPVIQKKKKAKK